MISDTDLIIKNGNIYHLNVNKNDLSETIILVGDPDRVEMVSDYFNIITHRSQHREFVVHTGLYKGKELSVISTGIGCDNIDIVVNELDALFNIDFDTREVKENLTSLNLIRLGTCGTISDDVSVDEIIVSDYGFGLDNLLSFYAGSEKFYDNAMYEMYNSFPFKNTYVVMGDRDLRNLFPEYKHGITATFPGFYAPQGRNLRIKNLNENTIKNLSHIKYQGSKILNFEMETSALYGLSNLMGHKALTLCVVVANRITKEFSKDTHKAIDNMIQIFLNKITNI